MLRRLIVTVILVAGQPVAAHDACDKLDCQRLAARIDRTEAALRRPHSLADGKRLKAELRELRAEKRRFCR